MRSPTCLRLALLLAVPAALQAQSSQPDPNLIFFLLAEQSRTAFTLQGAGARAIGTGGAFIAIADDATAVSFNPAGLAQLLKPEFSVVGNNLNRRQDFKRFTSQDVVFEDSSTSDNRTRPDFWSFAVPWKDQGRNYVFQISYQRILDFGFRSDRSFAARVSNVPHQFHQFVDQRGGVNMWSAAFGAELSPRLLIGGNVNLWRGSWFFDSDSRSYAASGGNPLGEVSLEQNNILRGWNWSLGTIWRSDYLNLGLVYRSGFNADYGFSNTISVEDFTGSAPPSVNQIPAQTLRLQWPETLGAGLGIHLHPRWLLTSDWTSIRWSKAMIQAPGSPYDGLNFFDLQANTRTPDIVDFHTGTEWIAFLGDRVVIPLRMGWFREPQPLVDRRTGEQRVYRGWTAGFGIKAGSYTLDVAYKKSDSLRQVSRLQLTGSGSTASTIGEEDLDERRIFVSFIWQLDPEAVKKILHWTFVGN